MRADSKYWNNYLHSNLSLSDQSQRPNKKFLLMLDNSS